MGLNYDMQLIMSDVLSITQLVGVATSVWTMEAFGKRPLLLIDSVCMTHFSYDRCHIGRKVSTRTGLPIGQLGGLAFLLSYMVRWVSFPLW